MQLTLNQSEITAAIVASVRTAVSVNDDMDVHVELKATRGDNGYSAIVDILPAGTERQNPLGIANKVKATRAYTKRAAPAQAAVTSTAEAVAETGEATAEVEQEPVEAEAAEEAQVEQAEVQAEVEPEPEQAPVVAKPTPKPAAVATQTPVNKVAAAAPVAGARPSLFAGLAKK